MTRDWRAWLRGLLGSEREESARRLGADGGVSTTLYFCSDCETTYIGEAMDACPECGGKLEEVPSERDLDCYSRG